MPGSPLALAPHEAHLWYAHPDALIGSPLLARYEPLLAPRERTRRAAYHFARHQHEYLVTRALVRSVLSRYVSIDPAHWTFRENPFGCPAIDTPDDARWLRFNLSNTGGLIACLVSADRDVGVDVENTERPGATVQLAERFFARDEVAALYALPIEQQRRRFFEYWTLKESYIKARGMGLAIPLQQFAFAIEREGAVTIALDPRLGDRADAWQFALHRPTARHQLATAIRVDDGVPVSVTVRATVPLAE